MNGGLWKPKNCKIIDYCLFENIEKDSHPSLLTLFKVEQEKKLHTFIACTSIELSKWIFKQHFWIF